MKRLVDQHYLLFPAGMAATLASTLFFSGCHSKTGPNNSSNFPVAQVRVVTVESKPQPMTEEVVGTIWAKLRATLESRVSGRIDKLPVVLGQAVTAGELVAHLDAGEINARLAQADASFEEAERNWKRISALFEKQAVTRAEYDVAEGRYRVAKGAAAEAKTMLGYVEVVAPFDGVVTKKWADIGDQAAPGKPLITIEDPSVLQLEADLPVAIASHVQPAASLTARVEGIDGDLIGKVTEIAPAADPVSRTFRVKMDLPKKSGLMSGQFARLIVPIGERNTLRVPASAVVQRGQMELVFVVQNGSAQLRLVKTGQRFGDEVEVLSGIESNEQVATENVARLVDGQRVEARSK